MSSDEELIRELQDLFSPYRALADFAGLHVVLNETLNYSEIWRVGNILIVGDIENARTTIHVAGVYEQCKKEARAIVRTGFRAVRVVNMEEVHARILARLRTRILLSNTTQPVTPMSYAEKQRLTGTPPKSRPTRATARVLASRLR